MNTEKSPQEPGSAKLPVSGSLPQSADELYSFALKWYKRGALDAAEPGSLFEDGVEADFYTMYGDEFGGNDR